MGVKMRHGAFLILAIGSLIWSWSHAFVWMENGGNILNPVSFFQDAYAGGPAAAFLTIDLAVAWIVFMVWVVHDARRIGLGARYGWGFFALSYLGVCFAFPIYLIVRERYLENQSAPLKPLSA